MLEKKEKYMNYYPNYNPNVMNYYTPYNNTPPQPIKNQNINKTADNIAGENGVFPRTDLNELYVKTRAKDGTETFVPFRPYIADSTIAQLLDRIEALEAQIKSLIPPAAAQTRKEEQKYEF